MPQLIVGSFFDPATIYKAKKAMGVTKLVDNVSQGYKPSGQNPGGVLLSLESTPIAFYDYPTLNDMVFRLALWQNLLADPELTTRMRHARAFWGESGHKDDLEIKIPLISNKVTDFWPSEDRNSLVLGNVQVLDTPEGNIVYSLLKSGDLGISSRGWGDLNAINSGAYAEFSGADFFGKPNMRVVKEEGYIASCWDFVTVPAVGPAMLSIRQHLERFKDAREAVVASFQKTKKINPDYIHLKSLFQEQIRERKVFVVGSGVREKVTSVPPLDDDYQGEKDEAFEFPRGEFAPRGDRKPKFSEGKNGFDPLTVEKMRSRRYRDIEFPYHKTDEPTEVKEPSPSKVGDALLQARKRGSDGMALNRLDDTEQRTLFDRMVSMELARKLELSNTAKEAQL